MSEREPGPRLHKLRSAGVEPVEAGLRPAVLRALVVVRVVVARPVSGVRPKELETLGAVAVVGGACVLPAPTRPGLRGDTARGSGCLCGARSHKSARKN